jgi:cyclase
MTRTAVAWLIALTGLVGISAPPRRASAQLEQRSVAAVKALHVQGSVYRLAGAGGNVAAQIGPDGVVLVDAGSADAAEGVLAAVKRLTDRPIRYIINTGPDGEHVGGNEKLAAAGQSIFAANLAGGGTFAAAVSNEGRASIVAHEALLARMSAPTGRTSSDPSGAWPTETFSGKRKDMFLNREGIQVIHQPAARSDSDCIVFFRRSDVIATGDVFDFTRFPVIDLAKGGSIQGEVDALNYVIDLAIPPIPLPWQDGGTMIIPGHGRVTEEAEVVEYRDMVTIIRDRVRDMIARGMTVEQVKAANPTQGYRKRYGVDSGPWTTAMFVEAVYESLTLKK